MSYDLNTIVGTKLMGEIKHESGWELFLWWLRIVTYTGGYCPYRHLYTLYISKLTSRKMVIDSLEENLDFSNEY